MRISKQVKDEIISAFGQMIKGRAGAEKKANAYSLEQLQQVEEIMGNIDRGSGPREAISNQIKRLEKKEQRWYESMIRGLQILVYIGIAVLSGLIVYYFTKG